MFTSVPSLDLSGIPKEEDMESNAQTKVKAFAAKHFVYQGADERPTQV